MSKNLNRHIKSDKAKWAITGIVLVLVVVMLVGMCLQLFGQGKVKPSEWFKRNGEQEANSQEVDSNANPLVITTSEAISPLQIVSENVATVSSEGDTALDGVKRLTASISPASGFPHIVKWSADFVNPNSEWGNGKSVSDYVVIKPVENSKTLSVDIQCIAPFGEQIQIKAVLQDNESFYDVCTVDYKAKYSNTRCSYSVNRPYSQVMKINYADGRDTSDNIYEIDFSSYVPDMLYSRTFTTFNGVSIDYLSYDYTIPFSSVDYKVSFRFTDEFWQYVASNGNSEARALVGQFGDGFAENGHIRWNEAFVNKDHASRIMTPKMDNTVLGFFSMLHTKFCVPDSETLPNYYTFSLKPYFVGLLQCIDLFYHDSNISASEKYNVEMKIETIIDGVSYTSVQKVLLKYIMPVNGLSIDGSNIVF